MRGARKPDDVRPDLGEQDLNCPRVHWFAPSFSLRDRLRRVARGIHMDDFVKVAPLPPGLDYPPGIKANREPSRSAN